MKDLSHVINNASINIYADDVVIYMSNSSFSALRDEMQYTMTCACEWYNDNKMSLNNSKCNTMVIDLASVSNTQQINILCNDVLCKQTKAMKYLGITIDDKLKCDFHMSSITNKVSFNNARLRRIRHVLPR